MTDDPSLGASGWDIGNGIGIDDGIGLALGIAVLCLPLLVAVVLLSAEVLVALALVPFLMAGQLLGLLPWVLVLRTGDGQRRAIEVRGNRKMLEARTHFRSLCIR